MTKQQNDSDKDKPKISIVTIKTPSGEKQIPIPSEADQLMQEYNKEFNLSRRLSDATIAIQEAKTKAENRAQSILLELMTLSNQTSMELGKIARDKEISDKEKLPQDDTAIEPNKKRRKSQKSN